MKTEDVRLLRTVQIRIFPADVLPFAALGSPTGMVRLKDAYDLSPPALPPEFQQTFPLQGGQYKHAGKVHPIVQLQVEPRKIVTDLEAPSDVSDCFFGELTALMRSLDAREGARDYEPIITTDQTTCVARLSFSVEELFGDLLGRGMRRALESNLPDHGSRLEVYPRSMRVRIAYRDPPDQLTRSQVTLAHKDFTIEIRDKTPPEDQIYFTESPARSDVHLRILSELEGLIRNAGPTP